MPQSEQTPVNCVQTEGKDLDCGAARLHRGARHVHSDRQALALLPAMDCATAHSPAKRASIRVS